MRQRKHRGRVYWPRTLSIYIAREVIAYTLLGVAAIAIVMLTRNLMHHLDKLIAAGLRWEDVLAVAKILATLLTVHALPVSFLFGILLAIGRQAADVEILAMRACGVGIRGILTPVLLIGLVLSGITLWLTLHVEPAAYREMSTAFRQLLVRGASVEAGRFNQLGGRTLYVDSKEEDGWLRGVMVSDRSDPERPLVMFAEAGRMWLDEASSALVLRLERGDVHVEPSEAGDDRYQRVRFEKLEYRIDVSQALGPELQQRPRALPLRELRQSVSRIENGTAPAVLREEPAVYRTNLERRYALPAAPFLFALVGVPIGMRRKRGARSYGVLICAVIAFGYFALQAFGELLATESGFPPRVALWLPNACLAAVGTALLWRERSAT